MKTVIRITLTLLVIFVIYLLVYWKFFSHAPGVRKNELFPIVISLLIAKIAGILLWKPIGNFSNSLIAYILGGGILVGTIGFILGFFGPLILTQSSNQGPLLGILLTGPLGFVIGLFAGGWYWKEKVKTKKFNYL